MDDSNYFCLHGMNTIKIKIAEKRRFSLNVYDVMGVRAKISFARWRNNSLGHNNVKQKDIIYVLIGQLYGILWTN